MYDCIVYIYFVLYFTFKQLVSLTHHSAVHSCLCGLVLLRFYGISQINPNLDHINAALTVTHLSQIMSFMRYSQNLSHSVTVRDISLFRVGVLAPAPIPKLECYPLPAVRKRSQHIPWYPLKLETVSSIRSDRTRRGLATRDRAKMEQTENY